MTASAAATACLDHVDPDAVVDLAAQLVRIRTVHETGSTGEVELADLVSALMNGFGWRVIRTEPAPGRPNVIGVIDGSGPGRTLMFEGHSDVVTEGDRDGWSFDPFAGDVVDGRLRGRGSADMKGGVAAMIAAARAVQLAGFRGRILVGVLADEEGLMLGAKHFAASDLALGIDGVIVCEPEGGEICPVSKGAVRMLVEMTGAMAHGAMPQAGRNPIPAVAQLVLALQELRHEIARRHPATDELGEFHLTPTAVVAGDLDQGNVIPATARLFLDLRTLPGIDHTGLTTLVTMVAGQVAAEAGVEAKVDILDDRPPVHLSRDAPVVRALAAAHEAVTGEAAVYGGVPGTTDGTILSRDAGLQTVVYGPGGKWMAHTADESVAITDLITCARVYAVAAATFLGER